MVAAQLKQVREAALIEFPGAGVLGTMAPQQRRPA